MKQQIFMNATINYNVDNCYILTLLIYIYNILYN